METSPSSCHARIQQRDVCRLLSCYILVPQAVVILRHIDVWEVTRKLYYEMLDSEEWRSGDHLFFQNIAPSTTRVSLSA